jgi:hypothetical protein
MGALFECSTLLRTQPTRQRHHLRCLDCRRHIPNQAVVSAIAAIIAAAKITTGDSMTPTSEVDQPRKIHFEAFVSGESVNCFTQTGDYLPSCSRNSSRLRRGPFARQREADDDAVERAAPCMRVSCGEPASPRKPSCCACTISARSGP